MTEKPEASTFLRRLRPDEVLLWEGRPVIEAYAQYRYSPYLKAGVAAASCLLVSWELTYFLHLAASIGHELSAGLAACLLYGVCYLKASHALSTVLRLRAQATFYAVTDRRIMILIRAGQQQVNYDELHLSDLCLALRHEAGGVGTVVFGISGIFHDFAFRSIKDAQAVFDLLQEAQHRQREAERQQEQPRYGSSQPLHRRLESGEKALWTGKIIAAQWLYLALFGLFIGGGVVTKSVQGLLTLCAHPSVAGVIQGFVSVAAGVFLTGIFLAGAQEGANTFYAITDRRLLRLYRVGRCPRFAELELGQVHFLLLGATGFGIGTVSFGCVVAREFHFRSVWDPQGVRQRIVLAKKQALTVSKQTPAASAAGVPVNDRLQAAASAETAG